MRTIRLFAGAIALVGAAVVLAQSPYVLNGLHTDLLLMEAVAQAEKLGGDCRANVSRLNEEGKTVQCEYSHCVESGGAGGCEDEADAATGPSFASYPIGSISLMAPEDSAPLARIVMAYQGDAEAVAASLIDVFGPTEVDGAPTDKKTWSNARRWSWAQGQYRMGLLDSPPVILLTADPAAGSPAGDQRAEVTP